MQVNRLNQRRLGTLLFVGLLILLTYGSMIITEYDAAEGLTSLVRAIQFSVTNFYPDLASLEKLPKILDKLWETLLVSIASTMTAALLAFLFSLLGSKTTQIHRYLGVLSRGIASFFRNIPVVAWAMILLLSFGQSSFTGFLALFLGTFGFLNRAFIETIDEVGQGSVEALKATGANYFHIIFQSVIPASMTQIMSWILYMIETNIRSAVLIGMLTGSGIGFSFEVYYQSMKYHDASLVVFVIVITVFFIEYFSNSIRRVILS